MPSRSTQTEMVYALMKMGPITSAEAMSSIGCVHLPRRIKDLKELGVNIVTETIDSVNRFGHKTHFCRYSLAPASALPSAAPTSFVKPKKNPFLAGMKHAARLVLAAGDYPEARDALKRELIKVAKR